LRFLRPTGRREGGAVPGYRKTLAGFRPEAPNSAPSLRRSGGERRGSRRICGAAPCAGRRLGGDARGPAPGSCRNPRGGTAQSIQHRVHADASAIRRKISQAQIDHEGPPSEGEHQGWILREVRPTTADALSAQCGRIIPSRELPQKFVSFFAVGLVLRCADSRLLSGYHRPAWAPPST